MKRYGILVEDKDGNRLTDVKVELTDFTEYMDMSPIFDSGVTDHIGFIALDPVENMKKRKERMDMISDMRKTE